MKQACINLITGMLGRPLKANESKGIEDKVKLQMRLLAAADPVRWRGLSVNDRLQEAAQAAATGLVQDLMKAKQRLAFTIAANDRIENYLKTKGIAKPGDKLRALSNLLDFDTKGSGFTSAGSWIKALQEETFSNLIDTWTSSHPKFFGLFEDRQGTRDLIREMWGQKTGNAAAAAGAKAWKTAMEALRQRFNAAGGAIGDLIDWHFPQHHSQQRVGAVSVDQWTNDTLPLLDRRHYMNEDGSPQTDKQLRDMLAHAYDSITTDGANQQPQGGPPGGKGMIANRNGEHRQIFFKDADSFLTYQGLYGEKSLWNVLTSHARALARDTGLTEVLGPNPDHTFKQFNDRTHLEEMRANPTAAAKLQKAKIFNEKLLDYTAGRQQVVDTGLAAKSQAFRNFMTATKLSKVVITALSDESGMMATAFANKIPYTDAFMREMQTLNPADHRNRAIMERNGVGLNSMMGALNRFGQEEYSAGWTGKLANTIMHASGAERMWDARRQGLGSVLMSYVAKVTREHQNFADVNKGDHGVLANKGVTESDWKVWQAAQPEMWNGNHAMITPKSIAAIPDAALAHLGDPTALRRHASTQLLAHVLEEAGMGAMDTGARQRVWMQLGTTKGTAGGEFVKSVLLFKSFAASMMMKHWGRAGAMDSIGGKFAYMAPLIVYGTITAALGNQIRNLLLGKDPDSVLSPKFWGAALLRGGGLGFYGDFLYDEFTSQDSSLAAAFIGPLGTTAEDLWKLSGVAAMKYARGERTDEGGNLVRFVKQNVPVLNLWYLQSAMDHILWNQLQEAASPGYLDRMQAKAYARNGTTYWYPPDEHTPTKSPDWAKVMNPEPFHEQLAAVDDRVDQITQ